MTTRRSLQRAHRRRWTTAFLVALAVGACTPTTGGGGGTTASSKLTFNGPAGDYVGGGMSGTLQTPGASFTVTGGKAAVHVAASDATNGMWQADFVAPAGAVLPVGTPVSVDAASMFNIFATRLSVEAGGRRCNATSGSFLVSTLTIGAKGVVQFSAQFTQYCEGSTLPLTGTVDYSDPAGTTAAVSGATSLTLVGDAGDYVGGSASKVFNSGDSTFGIQGTTSDVTVSVQRGQGATAESWTAELAAAPGTTLAVGTVTNIQQAPFQTTGHAGLDVAGEGRECGGTVSGTFTITKITFDASGKPTALAATFEQHCDTATAALRGAVQVNA